MDNILILGSKGTLGSALLNVYGGKAVGWDRNDCDINNTADLKIKIGDLKPSAIINCAAFNDVDGAEASPEAAFRLNSEAVKNLSEVANQLNIPLVYFSSNYVFDGETGEYKESDLPNPLSVYAKSKYEGEKILLAICKKPYLIRTSVLFGPKGDSPISKQSFVDLMLEKSLKADNIKVVIDEINSLTYAPDLAIKNLLESGLPFGIYHITNSGSASWYDFAKEIFSLSGKNITLIPVLSSAFPRTAIRPKKAVLLNTKLSALRPWQEALREFLNYEF